LPPNREFLAEIAHQLQEGLRHRGQLAHEEGKRYTRADAARDLNVSRASLQFYLAGKHMPSSDVLRRAMELWGIELVYRHRKLTVVDLQSQTEDSALSRPKSVQLELWESIKTLESDAISVRVEKKSPQSITLQVQIGFKG
jgi:transcriptional regulator with XRE-family HTH domain